MTHIVALTSYEGKQIKHECLKLGMKKVIHKPINSNELIDIILKHFYRLSNEKCREFK